MRSATNSARNLETFVRVAIEATTSETHKESRKKSKPIAPHNLFPSKARRKRKSKLKNSRLQSQGAPKCKFRVRGLVTVKELEEREKAKEVLGETRAEVARFGQLQSVAIIQKENDRNGGFIGDVVVAFQDEKDAATAFRSYDGVWFGGKKVTCFWETPSEEENKTTRTVIVSGMLTSEEFQDPDELADVEEEMMQIWCNYGNVKAMQLSESTGDVIVTFFDERVANKVVQLMNGSRYGGRLLSASIWLHDGRGVERAEGVNDPLGAAAPNVQLTESHELQNLVVALLKRLSALQDRAHTQNPRHDKRSRRLVLGMHEVRRGLLCNKIMFLVMATDLNGCDDVEAKYAELVSVATEQEVLTLAIMNRRKIGRSLQKRVRVSCVGVYSVEGANDLFQQILLKISQ